MTPRPADKSMPTDRRRPNHPLTRRICSNHFSPSELVDALRYCTRQLWSIIPITNHDTQRTTTGSTRSQGSIHSYQHPSLLGTIHLPTTRALQYKPSRYHRLPIPMQYCTNRISSHPLCCRIWTTYLHVRAHSLEFCLCTLQQQNIFTDRHHHSTPARRGADAFSSTQRSTHGTRRHFVFRYGAACARFRANASFSRHSP